MAKKGTGKSEKRLAASRLVPLLRKEYTWNVKPRAGPHSRRNSVALGFALRDMLCVVRTIAEAKRVLNNGDILVDGKVVKDYKRPLGLFDLVTVLPEKKTFRVVIGKNSKFALSEEKFGENQKLCRVVAKKTVSSGEVQLTTNDGRCFREKKTGANAGDSLLIEVPSQKIVKVLGQEPGKSVLVIEGRHLGLLAKAKEFVSGTLTRPKLVLLETGESSFMTLESNIVIVGDEKPVIKVA